ncbi:gliding motility-associated C-terminal domain-containing protein [Hyunsoonleella jejuensis]|uniref:Gliding motility-associated C-terminal domain-containing protein n=1 Tax=Hyunsoonleella jejuensis TaxID=419940 RepID=A0A1H9JIJ6_9FLAO|nr:T9SS type B sorting domain-containing protein [Hyunsoonleella jejuensis]SEQ86791.1 gliding motility-associated C-terminal domain-containing protein [Hyunsoonleella jejuensis]
MINSRILRKLLVCLIVLATLKGFAQLSKKHYIPPLTSAEFGNANPEDQYIYLSTPNNGNVPYTIIPVGQPPANYITGAVSNAAPVQISIGSGNGQLFIPSPQTSTVSNNKGYIIEADAPIYVSVRMNAGGGAQAGALVSKGLSALGTTFRVGSYTNANPQSNYLNFVSVMATEDDTQVNFSDLPVGLIIKNYTGPTPINVTLDEGESYTVATNSFDALVNRDGLIGTLVSSNKPIVVNCGSANGSFAAGGGRDYGIDQIAGLSKVGKEYIFVKGEGNDAWENVLIVAHSNGTTISINGNPPVATINAGDYYLIEGDQFNTAGNMYVEASEDVFAYQGVGSTSEANQGMFFVPPLSCETRGNINNIANIDNIGSTIYNGGLSIVTKTGATVTVNNLPLSNFSAIGPSAVNGKPDYVTYKITGLTNNVSVQGDDELYVAYFNVNGAATSGSFYSGFPSAPEINFDLQFATLGNCIPNVTLEAANAQNFDTYEWFYDDGSGFQSLAMNVPSITPTVPARYKLIGIITCTGETLESVEVPVSICPDDRDNDGIIDNLDIDNDNDGIVNCDESRGDVNINLIAINNPILEFQDGTTNNSIVSSNFTQSNVSGATNTFAGSASGAFTSSIPSTASGENSYDLNFTEPVNVKIEEDLSITNTTSNVEYYVLRITPVNKNVTLVDPDDRLLVDSNFDGIYESGITQISGSEIRFRVNNTPTGNTPFQFFANQVNSVMLYHKSENMVDTSMFSGIIGLTCFKKDHDNDGVKDEFDLDSDNDGIPDFIENQGTLVALSGIDNDFNGLDDIYDMALSPIDTDADGILDFYDLDSDNDGITDLIETGQLGLLSDTDLNGVEDGPTFGVNGWADAAETAPDSNEIGYTLNDLDNDSIFSYIDADSDGDDCSDVIEAGFSDANGDDYLGDNTPTVDVNGTVNNALDGYTIPNSDYLDAAPIIITTQPTDLEVCETSDNNISLISATFDSIQWEISSDGINWTTIIDDAVYSDSQTASLLITNTPLTFNGNFYRAFLNRNGNSCGIYSDIMQLTVIEMPIANTAPDIRLCDDDNNGTMPFDLLSQNNNISTQANVTITYHISQADANANANVITSPYETGSTTIYVRVENNTNTTCYASSSFNLEVYDSAFPANSVDIPRIQECDDTSVGTDTDGFITFDITQRETEILNGQSQTDFAITYFTDAAYTNQIATPTAFNNTNANLQTIYARVTNNVFTDCFADTSFEIEVFSLPQVNAPNTYAQCDDDSNDGQAFFNLTLDEIKTEINPNYLSENLTFTYYETQVDAESASMPIVSPEAYQDALGFTAETKWIRVENPNGCYRVTPITLEVNPSSAALASYTPTPLYQCDDGIDNRDGIATFNMSSIRDEISNSIFNTINVSVHFYESQIDAELETNEITDIANHENINSPNMQSIWVRVKSDLGNDCLGLEEFSNLLNVEALPVAHPVIIAPQCDFDVTDAVLSHPFDTSSLESDVLNGQNPSSVTISYFDNAGNPLEYNDGTPVTSPIQPIFISENQTITVRVTNNTTLDPDGACYDETTVQFVVDTQPIANPISAQIVCDGNSGDIDDDGFYPFDTTTFTNIIVGAQTGMEIYYNYIDENGASVSNSPTLPNPLVSRNQTITVEVYNPANTTCFASTSIELIVNPLPQFSVISPQIVCSSDPTFEITLEPFEANSSEQFDYEWLWTSLDGTSTNQFISNDRSINVSNPGTYTIRLTKTDGTGCSRSREIFVDASEQATITLNDVTIVDISENNSVTIDPTNLGNGNYDYALVEENSNFINYQSDPFFDRVKPGFYTVYVRDPICGISTLDISVIGYSRFFTPNGDGFNDTWNIKGINANTQGNSTVYIYDRYGKLIKQLLTSSNGWNGTYNGQLMPTDDYWFKVYLEDGRTFMGHFTLKR